MSSNRAIVVGGGIAGLTAAAFIARAGREVVVYERSEHPGGRGTTTVENGFHFNLGPHAVYRNGALDITCRELGLRLRGAVPKIDGGVAIRDGQAHTLPASATTILTTGLFSVTEKVEAGAFLAMVGRVNTRELATVSIGEWVEKRFKHQRVRDYVLALNRLTTYANAPHVAPAALVLEVLQGGGTVVYLDGGWQQIIDGLLGVLQAAGGRVETSVRVEEVGSGEVRLAGGRVEEAGAVVVAVPPETAAHIVPGLDVSGLVPIKMACLDLGLTDLPTAGRNFALGIDQPVYMSVHSATARLAPEGAALIQIGRYLPIGEESDPAADEQELEGVLDLVHPGWRERVLQRRFMPSLTVAGAAPDVSKGGLAGRPPVETALDGVYLAGDWVGSEGTLSNASAASARQAATLAVRRLAGTPAPSLTAA